MDQTLINAFFANLMKPGNEIMQGLVLKAVCLRHFPLNENQKELNEDETDELCRLQEALDQSGLEYLLDGDEEIHLYPKH